MIAREEDDIRPERSCVLAYRGGMGGKIPLDRGSRWATTLNETASDAIQYPVQQDGWDAQRGGHPTISGGPIIRGRSVIRAIL